MDELDPAEEARNRRRDREADAERRALLQAGMGKFFKQIRDAQARAAAEPVARPAKRRKRAP